MARACPWTVPLTARGFTYSISPGQHNLDRPEIKALLSWAPQQLLHWTFEPWILLSFIFHHTLVVVILKDIVIPVLVKEILLEESLILFLTETG